MAKTWNEIVQGIVHGKPKKLQVKTIHLTLHSGQRAVTYGKPIIGEGYDSYSLYYDGKLVDAEIVFDLTGTPTSTTFTLHAGQPSPTKDTFLDVKLFKVVDA